MRAVARGGSRAIAAFKSSGAFGVQPGGGPAASVCPGASGPASLPEAPFASSKLEHAGDAPMPSAMLTTVATTDRILEM